MARVRRNREIKRIFTVTLAAFILIASDVFFVAVGKLHIRSNTDLTVYADTANIVTETTRALRGNIYDKYGNVIAQDRRTYNIVCVLSKDRPAVEGEIAYVQDKEHTAEVLSGILHMDQETILNYLNQDVYQTELGTGGRMLSQAVKEEIESYHLPGIEFTDSIQRLYPLGQFASNLVGYAQSDENGTAVGKMGIELYLDSYLSGSDGYRRYQVDKDGYVLPGMKETTVSAVNGYNVYLTLDEGIQNSLEQAMEITRKSFGADAVWGAAMEIKTGRVVAWGQYPSFDPNVLDITEFNNIGAQLPYEPGSTLKSFTWAAAINEGKYNSDAVTDGNSFCFSADSKNNPVRSYGANYGCIYNARNKTYGQIDFDHGLIYSLNTVAAAVQTENITPQIHLDYLKKFGFFSPVDTDGIPEQTGMLNFTWPSDRLALSYGQGSTVTMLQLLQAYSAIFSDGTMIKPYFVESVVDSYDSSRVIYQAETTVKGNPITEETARKVQGILERTVNDSDGTASGYRIPECKLIGKTGTTEWAENGIYTGKTISSIMAAMPAEDPQVIVYYAFRADYSPIAHVDTEAQQTFFRKVAMTYGFTDNPKDNRPAEPDEPVTTEIRTFTMPNLMNHSRTYAEEKLNDMDAEVVWLGDGNSIIDQYPSEGSKIVTGKRIFLLTDAAGIPLPDLTGWTRKDITALWAVSGFGFTIEGEGKCVSQSVPPGTIVNKSVQIKVKLE